MTSRGSGKPIRRPAPTVARGNRWVVPAVVGAIVLVLAVAVVIAATGTNDGSSGSSAVREVAPEVAVHGDTLPTYKGGAKDAAVGMAAPVLDSVDFQDRAVQAGGATGAPYALVFLAHWCPHCQAEVPRLVDAGEGGKIAGVTVIGVPTGTSKSNPNYPPSAWLEREHWPYGILLDDARFTAANAYGLSAYPYLVFVDASGKVVGRSSGEIEERDLTKIFTALAAGEPLPLPNGGASSSAG